MPVLTPPSCLHCGQAIEDGLTLWTADCYSVEGCPTLLKDGKPITEPFHGSCLPLFLAARARFFDDLDEVMNVNAHFQRTTGMHGFYRDGAFEHEVSAFWTRADIEGRHL